MANDHNTILAESIKRLLRRGATSHLTKIVNKAHAADLSLVFRSLTLANQKKLFAMIEDIDQQGDLFSALEENVLLEFIESMRIDDIVAVLQNMPSDDVADLLGKIPQKKADAILERMETEESEQVEDLLSYGDETAGGIMIPDFIALAEDMTTQMAIQSIQKDYHDVEMPFYIYVVDENYKLLGVISLRQLVVEKPDAPLKDIMATDIFSVKTDVDQEEVARIVARYDILAVPVIDETHKLVGIVTVDDVIDIIRLEATEDMLKMAGAGDDFVETQSVLRSTRIRLPWLFAACLGGIFAVFIISQFEASLQKLAYLAAFIPVIMGMGGNIGTQSSTIVVRGLATGRLHIKDLWSVVLKELSTGVILGLVYGVFIAIVAQVVFNESQSSGAFAISIGLAVLSSMSIAALVGSLVPMVLARINIDPAVATGPFVTTSIDIASVFFYFTIATTLLGL
ncbi:MAG: magnesium transporter [Deltaproteobacteria bacterium]|nr:magnesium transporter [Deltaproteobacteria bacterium]MBT6613711.1 magnesium transporter [Deltaproteobacteria bacterium]